jgi:5-methylcytosine-specific restriction endonuclease McrA
MIGERPKRKSFSRKTREAVHAKYNGHCAYCGCKLDMKDMQVDHVEPFFNGGKDDFCNLMPACRQCNFYKSTFDIITFKNEIHKLIERCKKFFIIRLAIKYGIISINEWDGKFYFERQKEAKQ